MHGGVLVSEGGGGVLVDDVRADVVVVACFRVVLAVLAVDDVVHRCEVPA